MPSPCADSSDPGCNGPFRVQFRLTFPDDYEEQWVPPPGGGIPIAKVSEVQVALEQALTDMSVDFTATVTTWDDSQGTVVRSGLVKAGAALAYRGTATHEEAEAAEIAAQVLPDWVQVWTAEVWTNSTEPPTADVLDYAYMAGLWAGQLVDLTVGSGPVAEVAIDGVWIAATSPAQQLDPEYPPADRTVEIAAADDDE